MKQKRLIDLDKLLEDMFPFGNKDPADVYRIIADQPIVLQLNDPPTNGDKVRLMPDEELSRRVVAGQCACCTYQDIGCLEDPQACFDGTLKWLEQVAEEWM